MTLHDAAPAFLERIFEFTYAFDSLGINFNVAVIPFYHRKEDLPGFPDFVDKLRSLNNAQIVLHGLYHEDRREWDDFCHKTKGAAEEEIRAAPRYSGSWDKLNYLDLDYKRVLRLFQVFSACLSLTLVAVL